MLVGDSGVGKTCVITKFRDGIFLAGSFIPTVGVDSKVRNSTNVFQPNFETFQFLIDILIKIISIIIMGMLSDLPTLGFKSHKKTVPSQVLRF